jgi:hypothetical protein
MQTHCLQCAYCILHDRVPTVYNVNVICHIALTHPTEFDTVTGPLNIDVSAVSKKPAPPAYYGNGTSAAAAAATRVQ